MKLFLSLAFTLLFTLNSFAQDSTFVFKRQLGLSLETGFIDNKGKTFSGNNYEIGAWHEERFNAGFALVFDVGVRYKNLRERGRAFRRWNPSDTIIATRFYDSDKTGFRMAASVNAKVYYSNTNKLAVFMLLGFGVEQQLSQKNKTTYLKSDFRERGTDNIIEVIEENIDLPEFNNDKFGPEIHCGLGIGYKKTSLEIGLNLSWTANYTVSYDFKLSRQITSFKNKPN